jgi:hypothetical protein
MEYLMTQSTQPELTVEELTAEAMQLLSVGLEELYVVLGCQLMGVARPARVAGLVSQPNALRSVLESNVENNASNAALMDWSRGFNSVLEELKDLGMSFVAAVAAELPQGISGKEFLELIKEITSASMQVIVLIIGAVLKLPRQIDAIAATVAAIFCKSVKSDF